jgi:sugar lactone lactonase YvrE
MMAVVCVVDGGDRLGEGPCWSQAEGCLYWFDITGRRLSWFEPTSGAAGSWPLPVRASAAAPLADGGLIAATEKGLARIDTDSGAVFLVEPVDLGQGFRSNEGMIDPKGRFWWSRMHDAVEAPGGVYRTDPDGTTHWVMDGILIPNTLVAARDSRTLYLADSREKKLYAFTVASDGTLTDRRLFAEVEDGVPDGGALDEEGFLWNAHWGGGRVVRYAPDGRIDRIVPMPVRQPTSCAFGGPDLSILYVTSARAGLPRDVREAQPKSGGLFAFYPGVRGLPLPAFEGWRGRLGTPIMPETPDAGGPQE